MQKRGAVSKGTMHARGEWRVGKQKARGGAATVCGARRVVPVRCAAVRSGRGKATQAGWRSEVRRTSQVRQGRAEANNCSVTTTIGVSILTSPC